jgi:hypothetical protein
MNYFIASLSVHVCVCARYDKWIDKKIRKFFQRISWKFHKFFEGYTHTIYEMYNLCTMTSGGITLHTNMPAKCDTLLSVSISFSVTSSRCFSFVFLQNTNIIWELQLRILHLTLTRWKFCLIYGTWRWDLLGQFSVFSALKIGDKNKQVDGQLVG